jgi:hypothetical protein
MHMSSRWVGIALGLVFCCSLMAQPRRDYGRGYGRTRALVERVQSDLRRAERNGRPEGRDRYDDRDRDRDRFARPDGKERERFDNAHRHLAQFDDRLSRDEFDKDKLDEAIDDVKNVAENNRLSPQARDGLRRDLADLRYMRSVRGRL